jgi:hypothetical protein
MSALALSLLALVTLHSYLSAAQISKKYSHFQLLVLSITFFLPSLFRFNYYAFAMIPALLTIILTVALKWRWHTRYLIVFLLPLCFIAIQVLYTKSGGHANLKATGSFSGTYFSNLRLTTPPLSSLLIGLRLTTVKQILHFLNIDLKPQSYQVIFLFVSGLEYLFFAILYFRWFLSSRLNQLPLLLSTLAIIGPLILLSVLVAPAHLHGGLWTFLSEPRYWALPFVLTLLLIGRSFEKYTNNFIPSFIIPVAAFYFACTAGYMFYKSNSQYVNSQDYSRLPSYASRLSHDKEYLCADSYTAFFLVNRGYKAAYSSELLAQNTAEQLKQFYTSKGSTNANLIILSLPGRPPSQTAFDSAAIKRINLWQR